MENYVTKPKKKKKRSYRTHGVILSILLELLVSGYFNR